MNFSDDLRERAKLLKQGPVTDYHRLVTAALNTRTEDVPEGLQYVLIRGLSAMGFAIPSSASKEICEAVVDTIICELRREGETAPDDTSEPRPPIYPSEWLTEEGEEK